MVVATLFMLVVLIVVTPTSILANQVHAYEVEDEGKQYTLSLTANELSQLTTKYIHLNEGDIIDLSGLEHKKIIINRLKTFYINLDETVSEYTTTKRTVGEALGEAELDLHNKELNCEVTNRLIDGKVIDVKSYDYVLFNNDGQQGEARYYKDETVQEFLERNGIAIKKYDKLNRKKSEKVRTNKPIKYQKAYIKDTVKTKSVKYKTKTVYNKTLAAGSSKVKQKGVDGKREIHYKEYKYKNGKIAHTQKVSDRVVKQPTTEVIAIGTKVRKSGRSQYGGLSVGQTITGRKTHYCACASCNGNGRGITASGLRICNGMSDPHIVACNWLPLGAVICVDGVVYTVADTGGGGLSSVGRIDIFTPQGHAACYAKGTGNCTITILSL